MRGWSPYAWALVVTLVLPALAVGIGWLVLPHHVESGQCEGIGFGCVPNPADGLLIVAMIIGIPVCLAAAAISCIVIAIAQAARRHRERRVEA